MAAEDVEPSELGKPEFPGKAKIARRLLCVAIVGLAAFFAIEYHNRTRIAKIAEDHQRGRTAAESDWANRKPEIYSEPQDELYNIEKVHHEIDPTTGLRIRMRRPKSEFSRAYHERVSEMLQERGIPEWSMKPFLVPDIEMLQLLTAEPFGELVTSLPHSVNSHILIVPYKDSISIDTTPKHGLSAGYKDNAPIRVAHLAKYPHVIFVRVGTTWLGTFHDSGESLSWAYRPEPR